MISKRKQLTFQKLVKSIQDIDSKCSRHVAKAINVSLTIRNWLIGMHIVEFEIHGADRATYGQSLLDELAKKLSQNNVSGCSRRQLYYYMAFYRTYPQIVRTVSAQSNQFSLSSIELPKVRTASAQLMTDPEKLLSSLSYSHLEMLIEIEDPLKRIFYEHECIRGNWSVRELQRQIASLYFERSGLSQNKKKLLSITTKRSEIYKPEFAVRDPYIFEFLGLKPKEVMGESCLEDALLDSLQGFLLELGHGFCFEARQQRIIIGGEYHFVDLVFYHRLLKCHVLIELKVDEFRYEHIGQLNTYVSWYKKHSMTAGDNPPIGILLCTRRNHAKVEYALAGMDNKLFVRKYQLELPKKEEIQKFLQSQMKRSHP